MYRDIYIVSMYNDLAAYTISGLHKVIAQSKIVVYMCYNLQTIKR